MKFRYLTLIAATLLLYPGCAHKVNEEDSSNCWRYGVEQHNNTGRMSISLVTDIPVISLNYEALLKACGEEDNRSLAEYTREGRGLVLRACYQPIENKIYEYNLNFGSFYRNHEWCHIMLGEKHNSCNGMGYAQWGSTIDYACNWNKEAE